MKTEKDTYYLETDQFVGPFELLLELIEKNNLNISRITLSQIADEYLCYIDKNRPNLRAISKFIEIASKLALIKSIALLPDSQVFPEEEEEAAEFEQRVAVYSEFRKLAQKMSKIFGRNASYARELIPQKTLQVSETDVLSIQKENLRTAYAKIIGRIPKLIKLPVTRLKQVIKIQDIINTIKRRLERAEKISFFKMTKKLDRAGIVSTLLAFLEIGKSRDNQVFQENAFEDIFIYPQAQ